MEDCLTTAGVTYFKRLHFTRQLEEHGIGTGGREFMDLGEMSDALMGTGLSYVVSVVPKWQATAVEEGRGHLAYVPGASDESHEAS
ncbi:hypothetical protein [Olsenella uli]|uniref:hypothetical protein n=1 Tax=Olsenella uli TaxID=133926 RepID=UPI0024A947A4|nr:hypothetical protein [Olsenella uli]